MRKLFLLMITMLMLVAGCQRGLQTEPDIGPDRSLSTERVEVPKAKEATLDGHASARLEEKAVAVAERFIRPFYLRFDDNSYRCLFPGQGCPELNTVRPPARRIDGLLWSPRGDVLLLDDGSLLETRPNMDAYVPAQVRNEIQHVGAECALNSENELWCLTQLILCEGGFDREPTLLQGHTWCRSQLPAEKKVKLLSGEGGSGCALTDDGEVLCWPARGQTRLEEINLGKQRRAESLAVGHGHICVLTTEGEVGCWGSGSEGQLGYMGEGPFHDSGYHGPPVNSFYRRTPPTHFLKFEARAVEVYAAGTMSCAQLENGELWCWGGTGSLSLESGERQSWLERMTLGRDQKNKPIFKPVFASTLPTTPIQLPKECKIRDLAMETGELCVICEDGCVKCWGSIFDRYRSGVPSATSEASTSKPPAECIDFSQDE